MDPRERERLRAPEPAAASSEPTSVPYVTKIDPFTSSSGGASRTRAVLEAYRANGVVPKPLAVLAKFSHDRVGAGTLTERFRQDRLDLLLGLLRSRSLTTARYYSRRLEAELAALPPGTAVHVDYSQMLVNVPWRRRLRVVVDCHNVESVIVAQTARQERRPWMRALLGLEARALEAFERRALHRVEVALCCSEDDQERLSGWADDVLVFRNGAEPLEVERRPEPRALFVGTVAWGPNRRGLVWLLTEVWPLVVAALPEARLDVVGADPPAELHAAAARTTGVVLHGFAPRLEPHYAVAGVALAPLLEGSGSRLKILEAIAARTPVVSTTRGAEGIHGVAGITLADDPAAFAAAVVDALRHPTVLDPGAATSVSWQRDAPVVAEVVARLGAHAVEGSRR